MSYKNKSLQYKSKNVFNLYDDWHSFMSESHERGDYQLAFNLGEQYNEEQYNVEDALVFNLTGNVSDIAKANAKSLEPSVSIKALSDNPNQSELTAFTSLYRYIMNISGNKRAFRDGFDKMCDYGYAVYKVFPKRINQNKLSNDIVVEEISDVKLAFFDTKTMDITRRNGAFCGIKTITTWRTLNKKYKGMFKNKKKENRVEVIDFFYRKYGMKDFVRLSNGEYKRKDLVGPFEGANFDDVISASCNIICHARFVEGIENPIRKPIDIGIDELPIVYEYGLTKWTGNCFQTYPLCYKLCDAQKLINYTGTQTANLLKRITAAKYLLTHEHANSANVLQNISDINQKEGVIFLDSTGVQPDSGNPTGPIQVIPSGELPQTAILMMKESQELFAKVSGSLIDSSTNKMNATSGVAIDKMIKRSDLVQNNMLVAHEECINHIGHIIQKFIPVVYTENRVLSVEDINGAMINIEINKAATDGTSALENNTKNILNDYKFKVSLVPTKELEDQNTLFLLAQLYQWDQTAIQTTSDIYIQSMGLQKSNEISRRVSSRIPDFLIKYSKGDIDHNEYKKEESASQQQQQQAQLQQMQMDPQYQKMMSDAKNSAEEVKVLQAEVQADQFRATTERYKTEYEKLHDEAKLKLDAIKLMQANQILKDKHLVDATKVLLDAEIT